MKGALRRTAVWLAAGLMAACAPACVGARPALAPAMASRPTGDRRPRLAVLTRQGDARGAVAVAVTTDGLAPNSGALAGVALAALVEARLAARNVSATAVGGWDGWRARLLVDSPADAARVVTAVRDALLAPVGAADPALPAVARKVAALGARPLPDPALADVARCTGEVYAVGDAAPQARELEAWRAAAHGLGRVAIAVVGDAALADAAAQALAAAPAWPSAAPVVASAWPPAHGPPAVYEASEIEPGGARVVVTARTAAPEAAVAAAPVLGDPQGPLASRLAALPAPARVRSVIATAHVDGGCVAVTIDLAARDLTADAPGRVATVAALARQEVAVEIADGVAPPDLGSELTRRASDPRDAAERAAWWSLAGRRAGEPDAEPCIELTVGVSPRDGASPGAGVDAIRAEIDRATVAWHSSVVEARTFVERGQGEAWVLLASPCGTGPEASGDAGIGATVAMAASASAADGARDAQVEPFVAADGVGVLVHGPARPGESAQAHARRLADAAARAFAADAIDPARVAEARTVLLARAALTDARAIGELAGALAPGHPSWVDPQGTLFGLGSVSDDSVAARAAAVRAGPLRVAVVANADAAQADAAVRAIDRWVARKPGDARACPAVAAPAAPKPGTYSVDLPAGALSEAVLAIPLPAGDAAARADATWLAAALEGSDGLLAHVLGGDRDATGPSLARAWGADVVGASPASALVVRVVARDASIDDAVAQVRALLDRLRHGALREEDRSRAAAVVTRQRLATSLDPRARAVALWRGEASSPTPSGTASAPPTLDELHAFSAAWVHDESLVIVAARPPRPLPEKATVR